MFQNSDIKYLIALSHFQKFGPVRLARIKAYFPSFKEAFFSSLKNFKEAKIEENIALEFVSMRDTINIENIINILLKENINVISIDDDLYPELLKEIYNPPMILYCKGSLETKNEINLAVVGSRKFSSYGKQVTEKLVYELAANGINIVSGLALGIDALAHTATLNAKGKTIAVLGTGINHSSIYPSTNKYLSQKIVNEGGAIISEFPIGTPPLRYHFPQRNRIISGISHGVLVIEASEKSGTLITARLALEQNREVFAIPGNILSPTSFGANDLIKQGARPITTADEILEAFDMKQITSYINKSILPETKEEELILKNLNHEPIHLNELVRLTKLDTSQINSTLIIMEIKGMVKNLGGMNYIKM